MATYINTNVTSLQAQRNLNTNSTMSQLAMQRLSSGLRINSAKDDAAGLAISNRMNAQVRGLNQASRNANDGISLAQTAEGALGEVTNNLQRLRELAVQSANATNSVSDRAALQQEAGQLLQEIDRVSSETSFNGTKLLNGTFKEQLFQVGANAGETIAVNLNGTTTKQLGVSDASSVSSVSTANSMVEGDVVINGVVIGPSVSSTDTASTVNASASAIAKAAAINAKASLTGVTATVDANISEGTAMTATATTGTIMVNGVSTGTIATTANAAVSRAAVVQAINLISSQTGVTAIDTGDDNTGVQLVAADGRNINVSVNMTNSIATGLSTGTNYGSFTLSSSKDIVIQRGSTNGLTANAGLAEGTFTTQAASVSTNTNGGKNFAAGDFKINGVLIGASLATTDTASTSGQSASSISKAAAINAVSTQTGVTAIVNKNVYSLASTVTHASAANQTTAAMTINGVDTAAITTSSTDASATRQTVISAINQISGRTGVTASDDGAKGVKLTAADGRNITFSSTFASATIGIADTTATTGFGTFTLSSTKAITISAGTTSMAGALANTNMALGTYGSTKVGESLDKLDISTFAGANKALSMIDNALKSVDDNRSTLGAIQNRFTSTITSLQINAENLTAAKGRIIDADFAAETANMTKYNVLIQASTAILAQANQTPQNALSLLR